MSIYTNYLSGVRPDGGHHDEKISAHVAIVGSGPTGCFAALAMLKCVPEVRITVFEARPTPYGLLRYGVAPDHQGMKNVTRQFERLFGSNQVEFVGNVRIGQDLPFEVLQENFDFVVIATGLPSERALPVPVHPGAKVWGASQLLRYLNADPDSDLRTRETVELGDSVLIIGSGNVAMDVARLLAKSDEGFDGSDVDDAAREALAPSKITRITLLSRSPYEQVRWDPSMFKELCSIPGVEVYLDGRRSTEETDTSSGPTRHQPLRVEVFFNQKLREIDLQEDNAYDNQLIVRTQNGTSDAHLSAESPKTSFRASAVIAAIGFEERRIGFGEVPADNVLRTGGCATGRLGNLAENRALAKQTAQLVAAKVGKQSELTGLAGVAPFLTQTPVSFSDWKAIDEAEITRARPGRIRQKFTSWSEMSDVVAQTRS
ncbi:FAD-dependent oxidoreductase [Glutamicibacter mishrai]|nr:FAD-dependent oxidoreductase [Glutamicibacter mishrai]